MANWRLQILANSLKLYVNWTDLGRKCPVCDPYTNQGAEANCSGNRMDFDSRRTYV